MDEHVLCVDLGDLSSERLIPPAHLDAYVRDAVRRDKLFRPRSEVEDPNATRLRHLIPYLTLVSSDLKRASSSAGGAWPGPNLASGESGPSVSAVT